MVTVATAFALLVASQGAGRAADDEASSGQDITNPVQRIDVWASLLRTRTGKDVSPFLLRYDKPINLGSGWKLGLRFDALFIYSNVASTDNRTGNYATGLGDASLQALLIKSIDTRSAFGFGAAMVAPTATQDQFGTGGWRLIPTTAYRYALPEISPASFFVGTVRYDFDFAGDSGRVPVRNMQFAPTLNIGLQDDVFVTLFPSSDIHYDFISESWFVPFDAQVGKLWAKSVVTSLEFAMPIYRGNAPLYDYKVAGRFGVLF